jgi:hypothetical protein
VSGIEPNRPFFVVVPTGWTKGLTMKVLPALLAAVAIAALSNSAQAFDQAAAQQACGNDVFAICQQDIPDRDRIAACLRKNSSRVSAPCHAFMASYAAEMRHARHHGSRETVGSAVSD